MLWVSWLLALHGFVTSPQVHHEQLVLASPETAVLLRITEQAQVTILHATRTQERYDLDLGNEPLFRDRTTPGGTKNMPVHKLLGFHNGEVLLLHVPQNRVLRVALESGAIVGTYQLSLPKYPKHFFYSGSRTILMASMITQTKCHSPGVCEFFHVISPEDGKVEASFGRGKSFQDSFMKADIAVPFWLGQQGRGGIFYTASHDLHIIQEGQEEQILQTHFEGGKPNLKKHQLFGDGKKGLLMLGGCESGVAAYHLQDQTWHKVQQWPGDWTAFSLLGREVVLIDASGAVTRKPLKTEN
jgi:hypothetical protein